VPRLGHLFVGKSCGNHIRPTTDARRYDAHPAELFCRSGFDAIMKTDRRTFVGGSGLALAGVAGTITGLSSAARAAGNASNNASIASFGWEVANLDNNGADVFFLV